MKVCYNYLVVYEIIKKLIPIIFLQSILAIFIELMGADNDFYFKLCF